MSKPAKKARSSAQKQNDHRSDQLNRNIGTKGTNITNSKVNGHRGTQLNPNRKR